MLYLLKITKHPSQYKNPHTEYKLYTKTSTKKRTFKIDTNVFFFIDLKSRLHLKYFEEGIKRGQGTADTILRSVVHTVIQYHTV